MLQFCTKPSIPSLSIFYYFLFQVINLEFDAFRLESSAHCIYDSLSVYDGSSTTSSSVTAKLCGSDLPEPLQTTGNAATLQFKSDHSQAFSGFLLSYNVNAANYNGK